MRLLRKFPLCVLSVALVCSAAVTAVAQEAASSSRIVNRIDEKQLVTLKGTVHRLANARNDRGAAPDEMLLDRMHLLLKRSDAQETALRQLISDLHNPGSPSYHKWLTPDAFGKRFGPSDQDITTVENWLSGHGFSVAKVNPGKQTIEFSGSVAQFRGAFHAQIHKYEVNGETHYANSSDPQIPAALAQVVGGFASLNNFRLKSYVKPLGKATYDPKTDKATPEWTVGSSANGYNFVLAPQDFAVQYDLNPLYTANVNGSGQTIAIINESNVNIGLVNQFRSLFGLPVNPPQVIIDGNDPGVDGINSPAGPNYASVEAYLDVEWAGAVAPNATVDLVIASDTALEDGLDLAAEHAVYNNVAPIMSLSFGLCESTLGAAGTAFYNTLWEQAAAQGITVLVSSGDNGSAGCDNDNSVEYASLGLAVNGLGSTPYNVSVGGTDFYYPAYTQGLTAMENQFSTYWSTTPSNATPVVSIKGVIPEQPWNDSQYGLTISTLELGTPTTDTQTSIAGGSGGASSVYTTKPAWQTGFGDTTARDLPDLSLFASNGSNASYYPICATDGDCQPATSGTVQFYGVGGTSASTPAFAGIMALVNQKYGRQGQADYVLYPLSKQFPASFNDVKNGSNSVPCAIGSTDCIAVTSPITDTDGTVEGQIGTGTTADYNAVAGYDMASGLGTVDANQLVTNWNKVTFAGTTTTLTPSSTTFTHGTSITISGTVTPASGTATGGVALMTSSPEPGQQGQGFYSLSSGAYTGTTTTLPGGTYNIWGQYGGDSTNAESSSTPVSITVSPETSGIYFALRSPGGVYTSTTAPGSSVDYGTQLSLSAQVAPAADVAALGTCTTACPTYTNPTGTIKFSDNSAALNTAVINVEGDAEYNAPFSVGAHSVTASYAGDNSYSSSTAAAIPFTVIKDTPTIAPYTSIQDSNNGNLVNGPNQPTVLTVLIENTPQYTLGSAQTPAPVPIAAPTGTVTVSSSLTGLSGTVTLAPAVDPYTSAVDGVATFVVPAGTVSGTYSTTITYNGDSNYNTTTGTYNLAFETTSGDGGLTSTIAATVTGSISPTSTVTISGTVSGPSGSPAPTGGIDVYSSGNYPTGAGLVAGTGSSSTFSVTLNSQNLFQGSNQITLQYFGDTHYNPSATVLTAPISNPLSDFSLVSGSAIVPVSAPGGSGTVQILASSVNGYSGAITLTTTANSAIGIQVPSSVTLAAGGTQTINLTLTPAASLGAGNFNVGLIGTDTQGHVHTVGVVLAVAGTSTTTPGFSLSNSGAISISPGATANNTSTITVTPANGFTGTVNLTCVVSTLPAGATSPVTCTIPATASVTSASAVTALLTAVSTSTTTAGAYQITVTGKSGAITETSLVNVTVTTATPVPTFALTNNGPITFAQDASTGNTATITATPSNGFTGTITLTCAVTTSPAGATSPVTCTPPAAADITAGPVTGTLTVDSTSSTTPGAYQVTVTGVYGAITQTTVVNVTVTAAATPSYALSNSGNISVDAGAASGNTSTISVTPSGGFTGAVALTCSFTTNAATDPATCSLSPASVTISSGAQTSTLTISTTAATTSKNEIKKLFWPSAGGATLAFLLFFGLPRRRRNWLAMVGLLVIFVGLAGMGCGGGGGTTGGGGNTGTTAGTYSVTVTGTVGTTTETTTVTVTVN